MEFSKKILCFCFSAFSIISLFSIIFTIFQFDLSIFTYLISTITTITTISCGFYFNKAKAENLSKQKLRNVVLKEFLMKKLSKEDCEDIFNQLEDIDQLIENKMNEMYQEALDSNEDLEQNLVEEEE